MDLDKTGSQMRIFSKFLEIVNTKVSINIIMEIKSF